MSDEVRKVWVIEAPGILALLEDWQRRGNLGCREVRLRPVSVCSVHNALESKHNGVCVVEAAIRAVRNPIEVFTVPDEQCEWSVLYREVTDDE